MNINHFTVNFLVGLAAITVLISCNSVPSQPTPNQHTITENNVFYVDGMLGSDSNSGSHTHPWKTIQRCLDMVKPGSTCLVLAGVYNEALSLKTSGTQTAPIILRCNSSKECTINSLSDKTIVTDGRIHFYIIDGFKLIAEYIPSDQLDASLDFGKGIWDGETTKDGGNNGFIIRNCYVEGAIMFYGHENLVENCEFNGKNSWDNGITERMATSHDNIFRNNVVHDYKIRGIWSNQQTDNTTIEANTIYDIQAGGIDCDGAYVAVTRCNISNNHIYNITHGEGYAILLENTFDSIIEGNSIHDVVRGISVINYNKNNGQDPFRSSADYKYLLTNTIIRNNVIYNASQDGILCKATQGNKAINNTLYNIKASPGYWGAISLSGYDRYYCHNWEIKNNLISRAAIAVWHESSNGDLANLLIDYNFYEIEPGDNKFLQLIKETDAWHSRIFEEWKKTTGLDNHSLIGNPLFIDAGSGNFHLQPNSMACKAGENGTYIGAFPCN